MAYWRADKFATVEDTNASASSVGTIRQHHLPTGYFAFNKSLEGIVSALTFDEVTVTMEGNREVIDFVFNGTSVQAFDLTHSGIDWAVSESDNNFLLLENGFYYLQEDGTSKFILE